MINENEPKLGTRLVVEFRKLASSLEAEMIEQEAALHALREKMKVLSERVERLETGSSL